MSPGVFFRRYRLKALVATLVLVGLWRIKVDLLNEHEEVKVRGAAERLLKQNVITGPPDISLAPPAPYQIIPCRINDQVLRNIGQGQGLGQGRPDIKVVRCVQERGRKKQEVYLPFAFIKKYFDVYGETKSFSNGSSWFQWSHSYSRVFPHLKETKYSFDGPFLQFADFEVEARSRVLCVTATEGVPISTQWSKDGYYYSTQISQYALSHWSKYVNDGEGEKTVRRIVEDGVHNFADWQGDTTRVQNLKCVHFDQASPIWITLSQSSPRERILSFTLQFKQWTTVSVTVHSVGAKFPIILKYIPADEYVKLDGNIISYGYGSNLAEEEWKTFHRDILQDLQKGLGKKAIAPFKTSFRIGEIRFEGVGCVSNITLSTDEHLRMFFAGADWLLRAQDSMGGWPVDVVFNKDNSKYAKADELQPGWHSAMAQGHALSVLARAFSVSKDDKYLKAAVNALELFRISSLDGGFMTKFMESIVWYEEYPTSPSTFVLNGFMYSLLGLYDLKDLLSKSKLIDDKQSLSEVKDLFDTGMKSLKTLLPLFDAGTTSSYDLRHFTMHTEPKLARWDYHSTHINLLYTLFSVDGDESLLEVAERWNGYMLGKRAGHN